MFNLRLPPRDLALIRALSRRAGTSMSEFARRLIYQALMIDKLAGAHRGKHDDKD